MAVPTVPATRLRNSVTAESSIMPAMLGGGTDRPVEPSHSGLWDRGTVKL